jgi:cytochrome P450
VTNPNQLPAADDPHADTAMLYGPRFQNNPAQIYRDMRREHGPVAPVLLEGDVPAWCVIGYREIHQVTSDPELFSRDSRRWNRWSEVAQDWSLRTGVEYRPGVNFAEGDEHRRRGGALSDALGEMDEFELRSYVEQVADNLIDAFAGRGEADLMADYANQIPLLVLAKIFGLPEADSAELIRDVALLAEEGEKAVPAHERVVARMQRLVQDRHENPGRDVPSFLQAHPAGLTDEEIATDLFVTMAAGQLTASYWMGNTIRLMLTDERFAVDLSGGRRSVGQALNEVLWEDTPMQNVIGRWATQDTQLGGQRIRKGDALVLGLAGANTDPQVRPDCHAGAVGNHAHLSFSHGEHGCPFPAQEIARVITTTGIEVLLDRLPDVALAVAPEALVWVPSVWVRGLAALPVTFTWY